MALNVSRGRVGYVEFRDYVLATGITRSEDLQRMFHMGSGRVGQFLDLMESEQLVGPRRYAQPRKILGETDLTK